MNQPGNIAVVIGAGFSGLSAATALSHAGYRTIVLEKHGMPGGRARVLKKMGFSFDMGPSWYWMPEVMENFFKRYGRSSSEFFDLVRLDPSYRVIFGKEDVWDIPAHFDELTDLFEQIENGSGQQLKLFLEEARIKYETGMGEFVFKPGISIREFAHPRLWQSALKLNLFQSHAAHIRKYFKNPRLLQLLEFPVLFLGGLSTNIPALYSMMNYADMKLGTWYPMGGFGMLAKSMADVAENEGVEFYYDTEVTGFNIRKGRICEIVTKGESFFADVVVSAADYNFTENLLPPELRNYSPAYWESRTMAPSCLLYYVGVNKKINRLQHHNLFFENNFTQHAASIYTKPEWPEDPLYYVCCPSKTDAGTAPEGMENIFILIPVAPGLKDTAEIRERYFLETMTRLETFCGENISDHIITKTAYAGSNFIEDYNAFKGNAYGLANTLLQTAILKPGIRNKKISNLFYTGQLTVPGPGVPPAIISGQIVADHIIQNKKVKRFHESIV